MGDRDQDQTLRRVAALARLELTDDEVATLAGQLAGVLDAFRDLAQAPVDHLAPLTSPADDGAGSRAWPREDRLAPGLDRDELLARAPEAAEGRWFRVPPAIEGGP